MIESLEIDSLKLRQSVIYLFGSPLTNQVVRQPNSLCYQGTASATCRIFLEFCFGDLDHLHTFSGYFAAMQR
ncbi:MAG: hypothetical protein U0894_14205 [Pirellulales bacterium]